MSTMHDDDQPSYRDGDLFRGTQWSQDHTDRKLAKVVKETLKTYSDRQFQQLMDCVQRGYQKMEKSVMERVTQIVCDSWNEAEADLVGRLNSYVKQLREGVEELAKNHQTLADGLVMILDRLNKLEAAR